MWNFTLECIFGLFLGGGTVTVIEIVRNKNERWSTMDACYYQRIRFGVDSIDGLLKSDPSLAERIKKYDFDPYTC